MIVAARHPPTIIRPAGQSCAIVIFGPSQIPYLQVLREGYQHCMIAVQSGPAWQLIDPLSNAFCVTELGIAHPAEIISSFVDQGFDAVATQRCAPIAAEMPLGIFTCVEVVKRILGLRARWVLTPWQLRKALSIGYLLTSSRT
jgi:hypothetical protein